MTTDRTAFKSRKMENSHSAKKRPSRIFWVKTLGEFSESGLSVQKFCRLKNISSSNFYTWRKRLREDGSGDFPTLASFIPLEVRLAGKNPTPPKKRIQNQEASISPDTEREKSDSGLTIHVNKELKICIEKRFHEPTLQRLMQLLFSQGVKGC